MNAYTKGSESGWSCQIFHINLTKEQYDKLGRATALRTYKRAQAQAEFMKGWNERWSEPHPKNCTCDDCEHIKSLIDTY